MPASGSAQKPLVSSGSVRTLKAGGGPRPALEVSADHPSRFFLYNEYASQRCDMPRLPHSTDGFALLHLDPFVARPIPESHPVAPYTNSLPLDARFYNASAGVAGGGGGGNAAGYAGGGGSLCSDGCASVAAGGGVCAPGICALAAGLRSTAAGSLAGGECGSGDCCGGVGGGVSGGVGGGVGANLNACASNGCMSAAAGGAPCANGTCAAAGASTAATGPCVLLLPRVGCPRCGYGSAAEQKAEEERSRREKLKARVRGFRKALSQAESQLHTRFSRSSSTIAATAAVTATGGEATGGVATGEEGGEGGEGKHAQKPLTICGSEHARKCLDQKCHADICLCPERERTSGQAEGGKPVQPSQPSSTSSPEPQKA